MGLNNRVNIQICSMVVYMRSILLHKAVESRDLSQAEKKITVVKMTIIFNQNSQKLSFSMCILEGVSTS